MSTTRLTALANAISDNVGLIEGYFNGNGLPLPSFEEDSSPELPLSPEMQENRQKAVDLLTELRDLLIGPAMQLRPDLNATSLQAIFKYDIASKVPIGGNISFSDLAQATNMEQSDLERILRYAMINHRVFQETPVGYVAHTAASRYLAEDKYAMAALGFMFDECYQSFAHTTEALQMRKDTSPEQSGWAIATKSDTSMWDYYIKHPELGERTSMAMSAFTKGFNLDTTALTSGYDWSSIRTLVDLGGANGHVAVTLARANPQLKCIVQEIPEVVAKVQNELPSDVDGRVSFDAHSFLDDQSQVADAYLFRQIFHNWGDAQCIKMLRALIPALRPGAKIIINDLILPPPCVLPPMKEKAVRSMDMIMMSLFNSREREKKDWELLFEVADARFKHVKIWQPKGSQLGLVEATWDDSS